MDETETADIITSEANSPREWRPTQETPDEWIMVKNERHYVHEDISRLCESRRGSDIALFIYLLVNLLKDQAPRQEELSDTLGLIGNILERVDARLIDLPVVRAAQALTDCALDSNVLDSVYEHLLFNFRVWSSSEFNVRVSHVQYLSTLIKDQPFLFRTEFGARFFLDVISLYYGEGVKDNSNERRAGSTQLTEEQSKIIRGSLLGEFLYIMLLSIQQTSELCFSRALIG